MRWNAWRTRLLLVVTAAGLTAPLVLGPISRAAGAGSAGDVLPTGKRITPTAAAGSRFEALNPDAAANPAFTAGQAVATALSPDGRTLLVLTSGYNWLQSLSGEWSSNEYVFVYDVSTSRPVKRQVLTVPNTFNGIAWNPSGNEFYVSGGVDDSVHVFAHDPAGWVEAASIPLGHASGNGMDTGVIAAGLAVSARGDRLVVANLESDSVSLVDLTTRTRIAELDLRPGKIDPAKRGQAGGEYPYGVAIQGDRRAYVSSVRDREVVVLDLEPALRVAGRIRLAGQPGRMLLDRGQRRLYVAVDNADVVAVIDTATGRLLEEIETLAPRAVHPGPSLKGANPNGLALSPDQRTLFVTNGGMNSVAVIRLGGDRDGDRGHARDADDADAHDTDERGGERSQVVGLLPTGWYPNSVSVSRDGSTLYVVNGKSDPGPNGGHYVLELWKAGLLTVPMPSGSELARLTWQVAQNNGFVAAAGHDRNARRMAELRARIRHVIYVIKENRTYDQVLGDLEQGNGDPSLCMFPEPISPNHHQLARQFVTLDNFYDSGSVSGDGWNWSTAARTTDYTEKTVPVNYAGRGLTYDWQGLNRNLNTAYATNAERRVANPRGPSDPDILPGTADVAAPDGPDGEAGAGYLWEAALVAGKTIRHYGWFTDYDRYYVGLDSPLFIPLSRRPFQEGIIQSYASNPTLRLYNDPYYRGFDMKYPDYWLFKEWEREFDLYVRHRNLPGLTMVALPHDHFGDFSQAIDGVDTVETQMADNDYALGRLVEKVAKSPYKDDTLIFVVEDDAQDGPDHVSAQRSLAYVIGPYVKQGELVSSHHTTVSLIRTIGDVLGLAPLGVNDGLTEPMAGLFDLSQRDWTYSAIVPEVLRTTKLPLPKRHAGNRLPATERDLAYATPRHDAAYWTRAMAGLDRGGRDALDSGRFNRALWAGLKGEDAAYPVERHGRDLRASGDRPRPGARAEAAVRPEATR